MTAKSKHNRANIHRNRNVINSSIVIPESPEPKVTDTQVNVRTATITGAKPALPGVADLSYIRHELKWIGIVTAIVLILLMITYFFLR